MVIYLTKQGTNKTSLFNTLEFISVSDYMDAVEEHIKCAHIDTHKLILFAYELGRIHAEERDSGTVPDVPTPFKFDNGQVIYRDFIPIKGGVKE